MDLDSYFTPDWTIDDLLNTIDSMPEEQPQTIDVSAVEQTMPIKILKSPRRKTFGALINELREEIRDLRLEIELRDAYIFAMLNELKIKK